MQGAFKRSLDHLHLARRAYTIVPKIILRKPTINFDSITTTDHQSPSMPKASLAPALPLNGIFPMEKPSGPTSMKVIDAITPLLCDSKLFDDPEKIKHHNSKNKRKRNTTDKGLRIGQGGTLDPLADGVLVIGVNRGTKHLQQYLDGPKEYESIGILGASTTTMDAEGPILTTGDFDGITREDVEKALEKFQGEITQVPPIFSALKQEGKPLYEYARENKPLPRPIPSRKCTVSVQLVEFTPASVVPDDAGHSYAWPKERLSEEEKTIFRRLTELVKEKSEIEQQLTTINIQDFPETSAKTGLRPPTFKLRMQVSGGTYVRSIVHDLGTVLGCGAHVVTLRRTRQGRFALHGDEEALSEADRNRIRDQIKAAEDAKLGETNEEEAMMNATGTVEDPILKHKDGQEVPSGPSSGCVPWSVWERAIKEREETIQNNIREKEEALANGATEDEIKERFSFKARREKRHAEPLHEWEYEMLRRFIPVPVPTTGAHDHVRRSR